MLIAGQAGKLSTGNPRTLFAPYFFPDQSDPTPIVPFAYPASDPGFFYSASNQTELRQAFQQFGTSLSKLRLSR